VVDRTRRRLAEGLINELGLIDKCMKVADKEWRELLHARWRTGTVDLLDTLDTARKTVQLPTGRGDRRRYGRRDVLWAVPRLSDRRVTGLSNEIVAELVSEVGPV
jgi:hypothetical protein